jgi:hypothetical protein
LNDVVGRIWGRHSFGLSITTNGVWTEALKGVSNHISNLRLSIDPYQKELSDEKILALRPFQSVNKLSVNILWPPNRLSWLADALQRIEQYGIRDVLVVPQHDKGIYSHSESEWEGFASIVRAQRALRLSITDDATKFVSVDTLPVAHPDEFLFCHIDVDGTIRHRSWGIGIAQAKTASGFVRAIRNLNPVWRKNDEDLEGKGG